MTQTELAVKVKDLKGLKVMRDELDDEITALEDAIKAEMTARDVEQLIVDVFKVRWTKTVSNRFDTTAFKEVHADMYQQFLKPVEARRFSIA